MEEQRIDKCPTCGAVVIVQTSNEGTSFYVPVMFEGMSREELDDFQRRYAALFGLNE